MREKRKYIRLSAYHLVKYSPLSTEKKEGGPVLAPIKDIGGGGVCLHTEEYLPISSLIELKINFPSHNIPISTLAKVVWIRQIGKTQRYEVGLQFVEIEEQTRNLINERIKKVNITGSIFKRFFVRNK